tara:strand:- start:4770 stop:5201 length:432 start_codon:yes stop_codon:yes gene_type:complete
MYRVIQEGEPLPVNLDKIPIHVNDGTLRSFLNMSDDPETGETLGEIPKVEVSGNYVVHTPGEYKSVPMFYLENMLGVKTATDDEQLQDKLTKFLKKQEHFNIDYFKEKYPGFEERFYEILEEESKLMLQPIIDESGNFSLDKM